MYDEYVLQKHFCAEGYEYLNSKTYKKARGPSAKVEGPS